MEHKVEFEVRDSEIDIQGVVNNANYFVYMEHARHKFIKKFLKIDFIEMAKRNQNLFLISAKIDFKKSLLSGDKFYITSKLTPAGRIRFVFDKEVRLSGDDSLIAKGHNIVVCMDGNKNRPYVPQAIKEYFILLKLNTSTV